MEHKGERYGKEATATATAEAGERSATEALDKLSGESKGMLGSVWSAAGAIAESVTHAVQAMSSIASDDKRLVHYPSLGTKGTIDAAYHTAEKLQHDAETVALVGEYVAHKVVNKAASKIEGVADTAHTVKTERVAPAIDTYFTSPTNDLLEASKQPIKESVADTKATAEGIYDSAKATVSNAVASVEHAVESAVANAGPALEYAKQAASDAAVSALHTAESAKQVAGTVAGQAIESAKQAASSVIANAESAKHIASEAIASAGQTVESAKQAASDAIATAGQAVEFAKQVSSAAIVEAGANAIAAANGSTLVAGQDKFIIPQRKFELTMDVVAHLQRIADRTGDAVLHDTARKAHSACAKGLSEAPGVHLVTITPDQATELVNLAIMTQDHELADFARYCQSVAATTQVGIEPYPGKIKEELAKGRQVLEQQGRVHTGPGYGAAFASVGKAAPVTAGAAPAAAAQPSAAPAPSSLGLNMDMVAHIQRIADRTGDAVLHETARKAHSACAKGLSEAPGVHLVHVTPDQATELVNLAIRTQDHELANFARYCQSVAATNQLGIEPTPGKIQEEITKGRQELAQAGRTHTGPGYGAAFASISRTTSQQNLLSGSQSLSRSGSQQQVPQQNLPRTPSQQNLPRAPSQQNLARASSQQNLSRTPSQKSLSRGSSLQNLGQPAPVRPATLELTMEVVAHLQRIADRTGDLTLHQTARLAHSACAKNLHDAPGVHLTFITPEQATELVNLAIRTQDHELANFARYCQSVASSTGVAVEPAPGKVQQEIEKGRQELHEQGRAHTGPGYGAAFASVKAAPAPTQPAQALEKPLAAPIEVSSVGQPSQ